MPYKITRLRPKQTICHHWRTKCPYLILAQMSPKYQLSEVMGRRDWLQKFPLNVLTKVNTLQLNFSLLLFYFILNGSGDLTTNPEFFYFIIFLFYISSLIKVCSQPKLPMPKKNEQKGISYFFIEFPLLNIFLP